MKKTSKIIIVAETAMQSWLRDASTLAMFLALIGFGVWLDSSAMQWAGFFVGVIVLLGRIGRNTKEVATCYSFEEAREALERFEGEEQ